MKALERLEKLFTEGAISRRDFLARASALGLAAAVSPALLPKKAQAAVPKKGGHFIHAITGGSTSDSLDPATHTSSWNINVELQLRNLLVEVDANFNPTPELAESWEASDGAKKWVIKLRKGVEFHDGKSLDAEDVIYSLNHHRGKDSKSAAKPYLKPITSLKADGKHTLVFELEAGNADFPFILSDYHLAIFKAGTKGAEFEKGIGTGGYILETWEPGVTAITRRNPNYWKEGRAHFDKVETLHIKDVNARTNALKTGQIHYMERCERKTLHLLKRLPGIEIIAITGTKHFTMPMMTTTKPYDDNNVRLGLKYAANRKEMVKRILNGYGELGNDHPIASVNRYHNKDLPQRQYDPDKARFYMKKAGMLGHTFNLYTAEAAFAGADDTAILYKEHSKKAGIDINVIRAPSDGYWSKIWTVKEFTMCYWSGRPVEDLMFSVAYAAGAPWNDTKWSHKHFNELLVSARAEIDDKKRAQLYGEMQQICSDEGGTLIPMFAKLVEANSDKIGHGPISAHMEADGQRNAERWWFK
ncbi:MAG: twin-arginine translocation signal domain-containing protein [Deltaproteobacteria bacterium]|nr:twin-arginine translocation signal domain-containing protein [Deltaproteobacteria bacterium]